MPEMMAYAGRTMTVYRRLEKICDYLGDGVPEPTDDRRRPAPRDALRRIRPRGLPGGVPDLLEGGLARARERTRPRLRGGRREPWSPASSSRSSTSARTAPIPSSVRCSAARRRRRREPRRRCRRRRSASTSGRSASGTWACRSSCASAPALSSSRWRGRSACVAYLPLEVAGDRPRRRREARPRAGRVGARALEGGDRQDAQRRCRPPRTALHARDGAVLRHDVPGPEPGRPSDQRAAPASCCR